MLQTVNTSANREESSRPRSAGRTLAHLLAHGIALFTTGTILAGPIAPGVDARTQRGVESASSNPENPFSATLQVSEEAGTLMKRADEGIERQDWKLAIDSLQRIIELKGEHTLTADGRLYESARGIAERKLAALPEAGLRAYRLMHDGEAVALFEQARHEHDEALLKDIVDRFALTSIGHKAALALADWLMDEGRSSEAAAILNRASSVRGPSDPLHRVLTERAAVALAASGQTGAALALLQSLPTTETADPKLDGPDRGAAVRSWIAAQTQPADTTEITQWPCEMGNSTRTGRMDFVEPAFPPESPWRLAVPIAPPRRGFEATSAHAVKHNLWPITRPVTDGHRMYVKAGPRLVGIDTETAEVLWTSQPYGEETVFAAQFRQGAQIWLTPPADPSGTQYLADPFFLHTYQDAVGGSVGLAFGQVLTVEWPGDPPMPPALWREDGRPNLVQGRFDSGNPTPNRVAAYDPADGKLLWSTDSTGGQGELAGLQFLAVPLPVGPHLLAPCRVENDLYAVVLDSRTGRLVRHIYLCGTGGGAFNSLHACDPCRIGATVYLPTGRGVLVALDANDFSIQWILRYDRTARKVAETSWRTPQLVGAGDSLLLAPPDADQLLCIDRHTAKIRWSFDRGDAQCILATNARLVWLVGPRVEAVRIETGDSVWSRPIPQLAGRGALSGNRLYLPTLNGLVAFDAATGRPLEVAKPPLSDRLGSLLAFDFNLYSADGLFIRRFPDMDRGYARARALHDAVPTDGSRAIRLASLELLQGKPAEALAAMESVPPTFAQADPARARYLAHLQVAAMLRLAASDSTPPDKARSFLEKARQTAKSSRDAIDSSLALGEFHSRQGRHLDACSEYFALMCSEAGDEVLSDGYGFERRARDAAGQRLAAALPNLPGPDLTTFTQRAGDRLRAAVASRDERTLLWLSESDAAGTVSHEASLILASWAMESYRFEQAENMLTRVLRHAEAPHLQAEAAARLAAIYLQPDDLHQPMAAAAVLDRLANDYAAISLPASIASLVSPGEAGPAAPPPGDTVTGVGLANRFKTRLNAALLAHRRETLSPATLGPPKATLDPSTHPNARPVLVRDEPCEPLAGRRLLLTDQNDLQFVDADTGKELWPVELRLLSELTVESQNARESLPPNFTRPGVNPTTSARAVMEGQTLILNTIPAIHAVGSLTGRRLWSRPFDAPISPRQDPAASNAWLWTDDGYLVTVDAAGRLEAARIESGNRILWRRVDARQCWHWVRARQGYVVAIDGDLERTDVFRLRDGGMIGSCAFAQPADRVSIALLAEVICGPVSEREIAAFELAAPGVERWRFKADGTLSQIFKPTPDTLVVTDQVGRLAALDPATGSVLWRTAVNTCANGVTDGVLQNDVLYVCGLQHRPRGRRSDAENQRWAVAAVRWSDGQVLWQAGDLPARAYLNAHVLAVSANAIPIAVFTPARAPHFDAPEGIDRNTPLTSRLEIGLLEKTTGRALGGKLLANLPLDTGTGTILDLRASDGIIEVVVGANRLRIACPPKVK